MRRFFSVQFASWVLSSCLAVSVLPGLGAVSCTTGVFCGSVTKNARPILWKNRDSDHRSNQVVYRADGKYPYVGVVNRGDGAGLEIWAGMNSEGFAVMNSASYSFRGGEQTQGEGRFMKVALQSCATVADFQALLDAEAGAERDLSANFGVIDSRGGAAYFEVGPQGWRRFDAQEHQGYLLRTNYSASGDKKDGAGYIRMERAATLVRSILSRGKVDCAGLLREVARDQANERLASFPGSAPRGKARWLFTGDSICRRLTVSAAVFEGVRPGEDPRFAHMWVILGPPVTGTAVPVWPAAGSVPPQLAAGRPEAPMASACEGLANVLYPDDKGSSPRYMDAEAWSRFRQRTLPLLLSREGKNAAEVEKALDKWKGERPARSELAALQERLAAATLEAVRSAGGAFAPGDGTP